MCADPLNLERDVRELEEAGIDWWHVDIMDGVYVPNIAMNFDTVKAIKKVSNVPVDAHLMVSDPEPYVDMAAQAGVDYLSFHMETERYLVRRAKRVQDAGMRVGLAINPTTGLERVPYVLESLDFILIMTVEPGFAGQKFVEALLPKISTLASMVERIKPEVEIEVDGNMNVHNAARSLEAGAQIVVAGTSAIFTGSGQLGANLQQFRDRVEAKRKELRSQDESTSA